MNILNPYNSLYYLSHKDGKKEIVQVILYKQKLPQSKNDSYFFKFPCEKNDTGNECKSEYLKKINIFTLLFWKVKSFFIHLHHKKKKEDQ